MFYTCTVHPVLEHLWGHLHRRGDFGSAESVDLARRLRAGDCSGLYVQKSGGEVFLVLREREGESSALCCAQCAFEPKE